MSKIIGFVKSQPFTLISALGFVVFTVVLVMGMSSKAVETAMNKRLQEIQASQISTLKSSPKNPDIIEKEKERGKRYEQEYNETVAKAVAINERKPLLEGVFPEPKDMVVRFEFRQVYRKAREALPQRIDGGTLPTLADIQEETQSIQDLLALKAEADIETRTEPSGAAAVRPTAGRTPIGATPPVGRGGRISVGDARGAQNLPTNDPRFNAEFRARVNKARNIRCYYSDASFPPSMLLADPNAPSSVDMWTAQVSHWVYEDVAKAVEQVNNDAADKVKDGDVYVEHMPIKHLVSTRVFGYVRPEGKFVPFDGANTMGLNPSLTGRVIDDQLDVLRFRVQLVADQREVLKFVDSLGKQNFFRCLSMDYEQVPEALRQAGYMYGTDPCVLATYEFEGYMVRSNFEKYMPQEMLDRLAGKTQEGQP
jgi:hypothetical protein